MQPSLVNVIHWIKYEAQNMLEPSFRQELQCIKEVKHLQYIIAMIVGFHQWRQDQGWWPLLPTCNFQVGALATINIEMKVISVILQINMTLGERQVLQVLTTLQYSAEDLTSKTWKRIRRSKQKKVELIRSEVESELSKQTIKL